MKRCIFYRLTYSCCISLFVGFIVLTGCVNPEGTNSDNKDFLGTVKSKNSRDIPGLIQEAL